MPAKSAKQYRFMQMIAHGGMPGLGGKDKPSKSVARHFVEETPAKKRSQFSKEKSK